ncbi:MAG: pyridoxal phosphate-dependent aminotransferase [Planctomycetes bacterium]|nr:pyridoxal phosphate-dependent aminotransferase [Planctomycetota bacterium]
MRPRISERAQRIQASGIRAIFDRGQRIPGAIDLAIGQPHYDIPEPVRAAAHAAIDAGCGKYSSTQGYDDLLRLVSHHLCERHGLPPDEPAMLTSGTAGGLHLALLCLINRGDEVLCPDPYFIVYKSLIALCDATPVYYSTYPDWRVRRERLEALVTDRTRAILVNTPQNPTGRVLTRQELEAVADVARRHDLVILSDEIYDRFVFGGRHHLSIRALHEPTLTFSGFGKTYGMPGWRVSWATGPAEVIDKMRAMQQMTFVCPPTVAQKAVYPAFETDMTAQIAVYERHARLVTEALTGLYDFVPPEGAFYVFPRVPGGGEMNGLAFAERAIERKLLLVPGRAFSPADTHFRVSFAVPTETLARGLDILRDLAIRP